LFSSGDRDRCGVEGSATVDVGNWREMAGRRRIWGQI